MPKIKSSTEIRLLLFLFILAWRFVAFGQACSGGTAGCVQANFASGDQTASVTLTNSVAVGDTIAVGIRWLSSVATLNSISVSGGCAVSGGFVLPTPSNGSNPSIYPSGSSTAAVAYGVITTAGPCTISSTLSASGILQYLTVHELNVGAYDCSSVNHQDSPGTGSNSVTSLNCTTARNGDYLFGEFFDMYGNGGTWTAGTGFVLETKSGAEGSQTEDGIQSSAGTVAATFTTSIGYDRPTTALMAFQPSASGSPNFTLSAVPTSLSVAQGNQGTSTITTTISGGFNSAINLSASSVPTGATVTFNPSTIPAPGAGNSTLTFTVGSSTPVGSYPITVTGSGAGIQQNATVTLTVTGQGQANFSISAAPAALSVVQGNQGTSTITTTVTGGFNNSVSLSASGAPTGTTVSFNPSVIPAPGAGNSIMTVTVGSSTPAGTYPITVTGSGDGLQQQATETLTVTTKGQFLWSSIIDPIRAVDWSGVGIAGGIPTRTKQCGSTIAAYNGTAAKINSAIASCPSGQFVQLGAGKFNLTTGIDFTNGTGTGVSNVTLRGMGADQTFLVFTNTAACSGIASDICVQGDNSLMGGSSGISPDNSATWTANGYAKGQNQITLSSVGNLHVGNPMVLDQCNDGLSGANCTIGGETDTGNIWICETYPAGCNDTVGGLPAGGQRPHRDQTQIVTVTNIAGSLVTFSPGLDMPNWTSARSPGAYWSSHPVTAVGVENISLDHTSSANLQAGIVIWNCVGCWVRGVRSLDANRSHVWIILSPHTVVRDSYFFASQSSHSEGYGIETYPSSDCLIENNIFQQMPSPEIMNGASSGCVFGYNFSINDKNDAGFLFNSATLHSAGVDNTLFEGNIGNSYRADLFHGSHNMNTAFRNTWNGWESGISGGLVSVYLDPLSRYFNIIGNVLGKAGTHNLYQQTPGGGTGTPIYIIGTGTQQVQLSGDALTVNSLMRWGNYDTVTGAVRWCGNSSDPGWTTTCGSTSEIPSSFSDTTGSPSLYINHVPSSTALPASFYYSSKPGWWPSTKAWPPIGPDVTGGNIGTCSGGSYAGSECTANSQCGAGATCSSALGGYASSIPAMDCYLSIMGGPPDGTGSAITFNADACYSDPAPPTNLVATPQ